MSDHIQATDLASIVLPDSPVGWLVVAAGYLLGSVPFGLLLGLLKGVDVRKFGSGNIGATNVGRTIGRPWAVLAFFLDFAKGAVPAGILAPLVAEPGSETTTLAVLAGAAAVVGHCYPVYLGFKGGKGVATGCGVLAGIDPLVLVIGGLAWLATLLASRFVGLASLAMGAAFPIAAWFRRDSGGYGNEVVFGGLALFLLILLRHRANITRLLAGTEPRFGQPAAPLPEGEQPD